MKFLANENFPMPSINILRNLGYELESICEGYPGISDLEVIKIAQNKNLIILTFDRDYGEIIFKHKVKFPPSVIYFRNKGQNPSFAGNCLISILNNKIINFENKFSVIEENNIRQKNY